MSLFEKYIDQNKLYSFEGDRGVRRFEMMVNDIGDYKDIREFLADNPGAMEKLVEFVEQWSERNDEWKTNLKICMVQGDEDEDDENV